MSQNTDSDDSDEIRDHFRSIMDRRNDMNLTSGSVSIPSSESERDETEDFEDERDPLAIENEPIQDPLAENEPMPDRGPLQDPEIAYGETIIAEETNQVKVTFTRVRFRRLLRFRLTDFQYSMKIEFKENEKDMLLKDCLPAILTGLRRVIENVKTSFQPHLNRNVYITLCQEGLVPGIKIGTFNSKLLINNL